MRGWGGGGGYQWTSCTCGICSDSEGGGGGGGRDGWREGGREVTSGPAAPVGYAVMVSEGEREGGMEGKREGGSQWTSCTCGICSDGE